MVPPPAKVSKTPKRPRSGSITLSSLGSHKNDTDSKGDAKRRHTSHNEVQMDVVSTDTSPHLIVKPSKGSASEGPISSSSFSSSSSSFSSSEEPAQVQFAAALPEEATKPEVAGDCYPKRTQSKKEEDPVVADKGKKKDKKDKRREMWTKEWRNLLLRLMSLRSLWSSMILPISKKERKLQLERRRRGARSGTKS
jgi:hypothetical protein